MKLRKPSSLKAFQETHLGTIFPTKIRLKWWPKHGKKNTKLAILKGWGWKLLGPEQKPPACVTIFDLMWFNITQLCSVQFICFRGQAHIRFAFCNFYFTPMCFCLKPKIYVSCWSFLRFLSQRSLHDLCQWYTGMLVFSHIFYIRKSTWKPMLVVFLWILHLIFNVYFSSLNEIFMFGESVWDLCSGLC